MSEVRDETYYLEHQDEFDALPENERMRLLVSGYGPVEGDTETVKEEAQAEPDMPESDAAPEVATEEVQAEPVVLAKDGKHTIPFAELEEARSRAQYWEQVAREKQAETPSTPPEVETAPVQDVRTLRRLSIEAMLDGDIDKAVALQEQADLAVVQAAEARAESMLEPMRQREQQSATAAHFNAIKAAHPDFDAIVQSDVLTSWVAEQPAIVRGAYQAVLEQGTADQVNELLSIYKGQQPPAMTADKGVIKQQAADAVAKVKSKVPGSLSDIPATAKSPSDEAEAMRNMDSMGLMGKFAGKTQDQIMELMSRVI